jgi:signal transduction histidine kinase
VLKEHNGSIEVANSPDGGAVFTVTLPASTAS